MVGPGDERRLAIGCRTSLFDNRDVRFMMGEKRWKVLLIDDSQFMLDVETNGNPRALVFTTHGTLGQIGMNSAGLSVGINNLTVVDGFFGVTWPFVVRKTLKQMRFEDALASITEAPVAGAHSFLLFDSNGRGAVVEATPTTSSVE